MNSAVHDEVRGRLQAALAASPAWFTEIRLERRSNTHVVFRGPRLDTCDISSDGGGFVRCLARRSGWGIATFNDPEQLERKVAEANACARALPARDIVFAEVEPADSVTLPVLDQDVRAVSLATKVELVRELNELMLAGDELIASTRAIYRDSVQTVYYANSDGAWIVEERPLIDLYCIAEAVRGDDVQTGLRARTIANRGFAACQGAQDMAREAVARAKEQLLAAPIEGGRYPVVINPGLAGAFAHEAFGHLSESDFCFENERAREFMRLGRRFGRDLLNIVDSGIEEPGGDLPGTHRYDDEGVAMRRTQLLHDGVLVGRLHSRETAAKMNEQPTGNARAQDYRHAPLVRMRNTFIEPGTTSFADMIADIELGVYALGSVGGETYLGNFSFASAQAYMIRSGEIAEPVRDVVLAGNLFETLANVSAVGDDFRWDNAGRCGKNDQFVAVGVGSPHVRIEDVVIGGAR